MNLKERIEEIVWIHKNKSKCKEDGYDGEHCIHTTELTTDILKAIRESLPKEKKSDYAGSGGDRWMWEELRKEGYNQCLQEINEIIRGEDEEISDNIC